MHRAEQKITAIDRAQVDKDIWRLLQVACHASCLRLACSTHITLMHPSHETQCVSRPMPVGRKLASSGREPPGLSPPYSHTKKLLATQAGGNFWTEYRNWHQCFKGLGTLRRGPLRRSLLFCPDSLGNVTSSNL